ncbi:MAG TPA: alpha/beta hydrolase [Phenylobacterium sp.]|nr:alpha/beta hydrolase [Phenylobacterium sp.]
MPTFASDGLELAFDDIAPAGGHERTIVLVHGFASNRQEGWRRTGWYQAFERRRIRCVALDQRGHGESAKPHDPEAYLRSRMAGDVIALLDHLGLGQVDLFGYSMGARTALATALAEPGRISNLILGGVGGAMIGERALPAGNPMAAAMLAEDPATITEPMLQSFRHFADEQGEDRQALAACTGAVNPPFDRDAMAALQAPVLVVTGQRDTGAGDPEELAAAFAYGQAKVVPGCDHFSAIPHGLTKAAVFDFLDGVEDDPWGR